MPRTNALAYFVSLSGAEKEGLIKLTAHVYVLRLVFFVADATENKLDCSPTEKFLWDSLSIIFNKAKRPLKCGTIRPRGHVL